MRALDFEYDGKYLSDFGFIICSFSSASGSTTSSAGSEISFTKVAKQGGKIHSLVDTKYDECIETSFQICKNPDLYDMYHRRITTDEYRELIRWLNRRDFLRFRLLDFDDECGNVCYYDAAFNVELIRIGEVVYGLELTMQTNRPFGYGELKSYTYSITSNSQTVTLYDVSDDIGYIYPNIIIRCNASGTFSFYNALEDCTTTISNCSSGEIITINGEAQIIETSVSGHDIGNDFNYEFFRVGNTYDNRRNDITVSNKCTFTIEYYPIIKEAL